MTEKTKQNLKEWAKIAGLTAVCITVGFHLNSLGSPDKKQDALKNDVVRKDSDASRNAMDSACDMRAAPKIFMDSVRRDSKSR